MVIKGATDQANEPSLLGRVAKVQEQFLASKRDRGADLESALRVFLEFLRGFEALDAIDRPCVTVFGSARLKSGACTCAPSGMRAPNSIHIVFPDLNLPKYGPRCVDGTKINCSICSNISLKCSSFSSSKSCPSTSRTASNLDMSLRLSCRKASTEA